MSGVNFTLKQKRSLHTVWYRYCC